MLCSTFSFYDWLIENKEVMGDGPGLWCNLHIALMAFLASWLVACWFICKRHKKFALKFTTVLCIIMVVFRLFRMGLLYFSKIQTFVEILPWHLCHLMSFVFPIFYLTKTKRFFLPVLVVTFFGGILTFIFGDYYYLSTLSFLHYESLLLHFLMPTVVVACLTSGYFKIRLKDFWQAFVGISLIICWSMIGNILIEGANYLYLMQNGLPFDLFAFLNWEYSYTLTYVVLVAIISAISILPFYFYEKHQKKNKDINFEIIMKAIKSKL